MTRETKIGLLVGLAFIIVIGVLLSDHLSNTSADPQARLTESGPNVRSSYTIPAATAQPPKPVIAQSSSTPQNELPTKDELNTPAEPSKAIVVVVPPGGEGNGATVTPITMAQATPTPAPQSDSPLTLVATDQSAPAVTRTPSNGKRGAGSPSISLNTKVQSEDLRLVPVADDHEAASVAVATTKAKVLKEYKAEAGDTLSKMARKFYGSNAKVNVDAILAANPQMKGDATRVFAGRTYVIPNLDASKASAKTEASTATSSAKSDASQASDTDRASASFADNTVKLAMSDTGSAQLIPGAQVPAPGTGTNLSSILGATESPKLEVAKPETKSSKTEKATADKADAKKSAGHYTAKDGDTLWKIAASQMGSGTSWKDLRDANKDVLKGSDNVKPGMVLKLPAKK